MRFKHCSIILILILFGCLPLYSQPVQIDNYSFLNLKADSIVYFGKSKTQFQSFVNKFSQMVRLGDRQINILHIGDSHLQADLYTGQVRKNFQSFMSGLSGSRGMITPFLKSSPDSYKLKFSSSWHSMNIVKSSDSKNLSLWGTTAYTTALNNTIEVNVNYKNPIKYDFNRLRIYHSDLGANDNISLTDIEIAYQKIYNKEEGYTEFILASYTSEVTIVVTKQDNSTFYLYGLYFDNDDPGVVYNVSGTNGASALSYLKIDNLQNNIRSLNFDMVIISLGINDTYEPGGENTFETNLSSLVTKIQSAIDDQTPILLITPVECWWHKKKINPRQEKTIEIIQQVAKQKGCLYLDMYTVLGGKGSSQKLFSNHLMQSDKVHFTAKGYQMQGDLLYNALWNEIEKNF